MKKYLILSLISSLSCFVHSEEIDLPKEEIVINSELEQSIANTLSSQPLTDSQLEKENSTVQATSFIEPCGKPPRSRGGWIVNMLKNNT